MDTTQLRSAYAAFLDLARTGEFAPPADGWDARHVVAHVAVNDELLAATTQAVLAGTAEWHNNHEAIDDARLDELIGERDLRDLTGWAEQASGRLCDLLDTLPEDDDALVHTHILDGGATALDQPLPWYRLVGVQTRHHLPGHIDQLRGLLRAG
jgi:hypothetical protein